jgi:hypothetical protein
MIDLELGLRAEEGATPGPQFYLGALPDGKPFAGIENCSCKIIAQTRIFRKLYLKKQQKGLKKKKKKIETQ